jgi:hypothetical protein
MVPGGQGMRSPNRVVGAALRSASCTGGAAAGAGSEWQDLEFSIPMQVEPPSGREGLHWRFVKSPLQVRIRARAYAQTMGALAGSPDLDEAERALVGVVNAVRSGDRRKFSESMPPGEERDAEFPSLVKVWSEIEGEPVHYQFVGWIKRSGPNTSGMLGFAALNPTYDFEKDPKKRKAPPWAEEPLELVGWVEERNPTFRRG